MDAAYRAYLCVLAKWIVEVANESVLVETGNRCPAGTDEPADSPPFGTPAALEVAAG